MVNGEPFYAFASVDCQYQLVNGEYFFGVGFNRNCCDPFFIDIGSNASAITEGGNYELTTTETGNKFAEIGVLDTSGSLIFLNTNENYSGSLIITKLDMQNKIVSGTFEFEIFNPDDGKVYQITEGRFDSFYAQ